MKILTSSFNMNPPRLSVTYFDDNNKLKQFGADSIQIEKYVKESEYKTLDSLVNDFILDEKIKMKFKVLLIKLMKKLILLRSLPLYKISLSKLQMI